MQSRVVVYTRAVQLWCAVKFIWVGLIRYHLGLKIFTLYATMH